MTVSPSEDVILRTSRTSATPSDVSSATRYYDDAFDVDAHCSSDLTPPTLLSGYPDHLNNHVVLSDGIAKLAQGVSDHPAVFDNDQKALEDSAETQLSVIFGPKRKATQLAADDRPTYRARVLDREPEEAHTMSTNGVVSTPSLEDWKGWRDATLRENDNSFDHSSDEGNWRDVRDNIKLFPFAIHYAQELLDLVEVPPDHEFDRRRKRFFDDVRCWKSFDLVKTLVHHCEIRATISEISDHIKGMRDYLGHKDLTQWTKWIHMLRAAIHDRHDMLIAIGMILASPERQRLMELPTEELNVVMNLFQTYIDEERSSHRVLQAFLKQAVKDRRILPSSLLLTHVRRISANPVRVGGYADIWKAEIQGRLVALKVLRVAEDAQGRDQVHQKLYEDAMVWRQFNHMSVLPFYGICKDEFFPRLTLIYPWMANGNLETYLKHNLDADRPWIAKEVTAGLCYLHSLKPPIVHGDLRASNILIDERRIARIAGFGLEKLFNSHGCSSVNGKSTIRWKAPELLNASQFPGKAVGNTSKSDVYAFAMLCLEIFTDNIPFPDLHNDEVITEVVVYNKRPLRPAEPATQRGLDDRMWDIMEECWRTHHTDRPDMDVVADRLYMSSIVEASDKFSAHDFPLKPLQGTNLRNDSTQ